MWPKNKQYLQIRETINELWPEHIKWFKKLKAPTTPEEFALEICFVIHHSGVKAILESNAWFTQVYPVLINNGSAHEVLGHSGKANAVDMIWKERIDLFNEYQANNNKLEFISTLPWVGEITKHHLARSFELDCAKPGRWIAELADASGEAANVFSNRLAKETKDNIHVVNFTLEHAYRSGWLDVVNGRVIAGREIPNKLNRQIFSSNKTTKSEINLLCMCW